MTIAQNPEKADRRLRIAIAAMLFSLIGLLVLAMRKEQPDSPGVVIPQSEIDIGQVGPGETKRVEFRIVNPEPTPVDIIKVSTDCWCTVVAHFLKQIAGGEDYFLPVIYKGQGTDGMKFRRNITICFRSREQPLCRNLVLRGRINERRSLFAAPNPLDFGRVRSGPAVHRTITFRADSALINALPDRIRIETAADAKSDLPIPLVTGQLRGVMAEKKVRVLLDPAPAVESLRFCTSVVFQGRGALKTRLELPVFAIIEPPVTIAPSRLVFRRRSSERTIRATLTLDSNTDGPLRIASYNWTLPFDVSITQEDAASNRFLVTLDLESDGAANEALSGMLELNTASPSARLNIPSIFLPSSSSSRE